MKPAGEWEKGKDADAIEAFKTPAFKMYCEMPVASPVRVARKFGLPPETVQAWAKNEGWSERRQDAMVGAVEDELFAAGVKTPNELIHSIWKGVRTVLRDIERNKKNESINLDSANKAMQIYERADRIEGSLRGKLGLKSRSVNR